MLRRGNRHAAVKLKKRRPNVKRADRSAQFTDESVAAFEQSDTAQQSRFRAKLEDTRQGDFIGKAQMQSALDAVKRGLRRFVTGVEVIVVAFLVVAGVAYWQSIVKGDERAIQRIEVAGEQPQQLREAMRDALVGYQGQGFFQVDLQQMQADLVAVPWIRDAAVNRQWPDSIVVDIETWHPVAKWGDNQWLDNTGQVFSLETDRNIRTNLPQLYGNEKDAVEIFKMHNQIVALFDRFDMQLSSLEKMRSGGWLLTMGTGVDVRINDKDVFAGLEDFVTLYGQLAGQRYNVEYIDMRYPNGGAIRWREQEVASINSQEILGADNTSLQ